MRLEALARLRASQGVAPARTASTSAASARPRKAPASQRCLNGLGRACRRAHRCGTALALHCFPALTRRRENVYRVRIPCRLLSEATSFTRSSSSRGHGSGRRDSQRRIPTPTAESLPLRMSSSQEGTYAARPSSQTSRVTAQYKASSVPLTEVLLNAPARCLVGRPGSRPALLQYRSHPSVRLGPCGRQASHSD